MDALRFFAAITVMIHHLTFMFWANPDHHGTPTANLFLIYFPLAPFSATGWIGVQIFFVISGFVIALTANGRSPIAFLKSRFLRLVPAVWICATLSVPILFFGGQNLRLTLEQYIGSLLFAPNGPWVASSYWTLTLEIVFYAAIFVMLCLNQFKKADIFVYVLGSISTLVWCAYWIGVSIEPSLLSRVLLFPGNSRIGQLLLWQHGCFFAIGTLVWLIMNRGLTRGRAIAALIFTTTGALQIASEVTKAGAWTGYPETMGTPILMWLGSVALLVLSIRFNDRIRAVVGDRSREIRTLGLATYPFYLLHQPVGFPIMFMLLTHGCPPALALVAGMAGVLAVAILVASILEPWLRGIVSGKIDAIESHLPLARLRSPTTTVPLAAAKATIEAA
ncbi:MAG: acyltransferase [Caulobacteraceae bacterium]